MAASPTNPALERAYANTAGPVAFLDETYQAPSAEFAGFYVFTAVLVDRTEMSDLRLTLRELAGGTFWHSTDELQTGEGWKRARRILEYLGQGPEVCVLAYERAVELDDTDVERARRACLRGLLAGLSAGGPAWPAVRLAVFEERTPRNRANFDRRHVKELRQQGLIERGMQVVMTSPKFEHLLWLPDVVSSAFRRSITGRQSMELLTPVIGQVHFVDPRP